MTLKLLPKEYKLTRRPVFTKLFTIKLSDCQTVKANIGNTVIWRFAVDSVDSVFCFKGSATWESTVYIYVEYSKIMLN